MKFSIQLGCVQWEVWVESMLSNTRNCVYICRHTFFSLNKYIYHYSLYKHPFENSAYKPASENLKDCTFVACSCGGQILMLLLLTLGTRRGSLRSKKMSKTQIIFSDCLVQANSR